MGQGLRPAEVLDIRNRLWLAIEGMPYALVPPKAREAVVAEAQGEVA